RQAEKRSDRYQQRLKKHHKRIERHKRRPKYGVVINTLPLGYHRGLNRRHHDHYYRGGLFYRYSGGHYLSVRPPYGMIVATLPLGYLTLQFGTGVYARYNDVYYRPVPRGYMVVEPPLSAPPAPQPNIGAVPANAVGTVTVSIEVLNVRSGPSRLHPVADHVYSGDLLYVLGQAPDWYYVKLPQGGFGWVWAEFAVGALRP
ncbi:MAG: SH3 domain-containing protein, partial [Desulfuromonas sp.]|nr:SH3 domain-containing protein [Desulfuromonas sp.]